MIYHLETKTGRPLLVRHARTGRDLAITNVGDGMRVAKLAARRGGAMVRLLRTHEGRTVTIATVGAAERMREVPVPIGPGANEEIEELEGVA